MHPQPKTLPAVLAVAFALPVFFPASLHAAPTNNDEEPLTVVVTATRFVTADPRIAANISIISRDDIRKSPARNLPDLLQSRAGISVRALYGNEGLDANIDLRGFGDAAGSNTLILLDGQRLNAVDSSPISWSAIPLASVQRIEIIRGAGTVLYGDRATGGVINIITDKSGQPGASVEASIGSQDTRALATSLAGGADDFYYRLHARHAHSNGWRDNGQSEQNTGSGRIGLHTGSGEVFADFAVYQDASGLPGYLRQSDYEERPRHSRSPHDSQQRQGQRLRPGFSFALSPSLRLAAEIAGENETYRYHSPTYRSQRERDNLSFTPRLSWQHTLGGLKSDSVFGFDHYRGNVEARSNSGPAQGAEQQSNAFYLQNQTELLRGLTLTLGARSQQMKQEARQAATSGPFGSPAMHGEATRRRNAWDSGLAYAADGWRLYGKLGTTFRFANTDELFAYDPFTFAPVFAGDLRPQHGSIREIGGSFRLGTISTRLSAYRMNLNDEIAYDGNLYANVNFDSTRRQGGEAEIDWQIAGPLSARLAYAYTEATFRSGANAGKQLPLVAPHSGSLQLNWDAGSAGRYTVVANAVGERHYSGDFAHQRKSLAGYTRVDLQAEWKLTQWSLNLALLNALDKRYSPFAGYSPSISDYYYYPADGRSLRLTARYDFK